MEKRRELSDRTGARQTKLSHRSRKGPCFLQLGRDRPHPLASVADAFLTLGLNLPTHTIGAPPLSNSAEISETRGMPPLSLSSLTRARVLFVFAHPDAESTSLGGALNQFQDPWFACLTDGAPRDPRQALAASCSSPATYARQRRRELAIALALAGHDSERLIALGFADQELALSLESLTQAVEVLLHRVRPEFVITHPYEGSHPDHDAAAFAVHTALAAQAEREPVPTIVETTSYHARNGEPVWAQFLPDTGEEPLAIKLTSAQRAHKKRLLSVHASQASSLRHVPLDYERLRRAPRYDFSRPPHTGQLLYETFDGSMTGEKWREAAVVALERLHLTALASTAY